MKAHVFAVLSCATFFGASLPGQFPGDVFFAVPSQAIATGAEGELLLQGFYGAETPGAIHTRVTFPAAQLEVLSVVAPSTDFDDRFKFVSKPGVLDLINQRDPTSRDPIGTLDLARVRFRVLAPAGATIDIASEVRGAIALRSVPYPSRAGFGAQITVISSAPSGQGSGNADGAVAPVGVADVPVLDVPGWLVGGFPTPPRPEGAVVARFQAVWTGWEWVARRVLIAPWPLLGPRDD